MTLSCMEAMFGWFQ